MSCDEARVESAQAATVRGSEQPTKGTQGNMGMGQSASLSVRVVGASPGSEGSQQRF